MSSILDLEKNLLFIHVPKTAGSSITRLICDDPPDFDGLVNPSQRHVRLGRFHWPASKIRMEFPDLFEQALSFAIVRNPFSWLQSIRYYQANSPTPPHHKEAKNLSFGDFIKYFVERDKRSMNFFVCDQNKKIIVDRVLKFEDFENEVLPFLARYFDVSQLRHTMRTRKPGLAEDFDLDTFKLVQETYSDDIALFGYEELTSNLEEAIRAKRA